MIMMLLGTFCFEEPFYFESRHAAGARGRNGLAIAAILYITASVDAGDARVHVIVSDEISIGIGIELLFEHARVRNVPDA